MEGLGNAPIKKRFDDGEVSVIHFETTKPLPAYLFAIAIGKLEVLEAPENAMAGVPLRLFTTAKKSPLGAYALKTVSKLYSELKRTWLKDIPSRSSTSSPYPVPRPAQWRTGLITFRETLLLVEEKQAPPERLMWAQVALAHELAHSYFGNLVTPLNWNELWLSEAFSTWMARRLVTSIEPKLGIGLARIAGTSRLMRHDIPGRMPPIRGSRHTAYKAPDSGTGFEHAKGAAIIRMVHA